MTLKRNPAEFYASDRAAWRAWLTTHHLIEDAVWLTYDKGPGRRLQWADIVQEALCFGWIDSKPAKLSDTQSKIYVSKRNPRSVWSKINKGHVDVLLEKGLMMPAGQAVIDKAKRNGAWDTLNKSDALEIPDDLQILLDTNDMAKANFFLFSDSSKRIILQWIYSAKREETRMSRIHQTVELAAQNIKANHYRQ